LIPFTHKGRVLGARRGALSVLDYRRSLSVSVVYILIISIKHQTPNTLDP